MFTVRAPVAGYNGISAGVRFTAGVGYTDNPAALAYFRRAGYAIGSDAAPSEPAPELPVETASEGVEVTFTIEDVSPEVIAEAAAQIAADSPFAPSPDAIAPEPAPARPRGPRKPTPRRTGRR